MQHKSDCATVLGACLTASDLQVLLQNKQLLMFLNNKCFSGWHQSKMQHKSDCATVLGACLTASDTFWASLLADVASLIRSGSLNPE